MQLWPPARAALMAVTTPAAVPPYTTTSKFFVTAETAGNGATNKAKRTRTSRSTRCIGRYFILGRGERGQLFRGFLALPAALLRVIASGTFRAMVRGHRRLCSVSLLAGEMCVKLVRFPELRLWRYAHHRNRGQGAKRKSHGYEAPGYQQQTDSRRA